jgi:drug/metabolite transporter (DMT)-like permease
VPYRTGMFFALGASALWGTSAFMAGLTARRVPALAVVFYSQAASLAVLAAGVAVWPAQPVTADVAWGAAAGVGTVIALSSFYKGLSVGRMSVVSPLTGLIAVATPTAVEVARGTPPSGFVVAGLAVAMAAIVLLSTSTHGVEAGRPSGIGYAVAAGLGFSLFLIALDQASASAGLWPLVGTRMVSAGVLGVILITTGRAATAAARADWRPLAAIGVIDVTGASLYFAATALTTLTTAVVLSSLHPLVTVLWARLLLREPLGPLRLAGVAASLAAIVLIVSG